MRDFTKPDIIEAPKEHRALALTLRSLVDQHPADLTAPAWQKDGRVIVRAVTPDGAEALTKLAETLTSEQVAVIDSGDGLPDPTLLSQQKLSDTAANALRHIRAQKTDMICAEAWNGVDGQTISMRCKSFVPEVGASLVKTFGADRITVEIDPTLVVPQTAG